MKDYLDRFTNKLKWVGDCLEFQGWKDIILIRKRILEGIYQKDIAKEFNVSQALINQINTGKSWSHVD